MKFFALAALAGSTSAQAPLCQESSECVDAFGPGVETCCGQLQVAGLPEVASPNYGGFAPYIWRLGDGEEMTVGHSVNLCLPKSYIERHAQNEGEDGTMSALDNLQDVLDTVPNVQASYFIDGVTTAEGWVTAYGADLETIKGLREKAGCVAGDFGFDSLNTGMEEGSSTLVLSLATALGISTLLA